MFEFHFFTEKKTLNLNNKKDFSDNTFFVLFVFSKTVINNRFRKQEPNRTLIFKFFLQLNTFIII